ncbi:MAG: BASS family bile acid:Na+ symporter [Saprospiraceae bacterium]|jgi:BASS family bile acid:Na+ symporter
MDNTSTAILAISLFIIMTGMGLSLKIDDFKRVLKVPKAVFLGFLNQIILLPIIAYLLIGVFDVSASLAIGIMILSACPGGPTSNLLTHLAKGDTALSVTLTAINSLITIITIPLIVNFSLEQFASESMEIVAPIGEIAGSLVVIIAVPLAIGMSLNKYKSSLATKMDKPVKIASITLLVIIIVGLAVKERAHLVDYVRDSWMIVLALNVTTMLVGYLTAKIAKLNFKQAITICLESGNQNGTLAISIASFSLGQVDFAIAAAIYSLMMYFTASIPILISSRRNEN